MPNRKTLAQTYQMQFFQLMRQLKHYMFVITSRTDLVVFIVFTSGILLAYRLLLLAICFGWQKNIESAKCWVSWFTCVMLFSTHLRNIFGHCVGTWVVRSCFFRMKCNTSPLLFWVYFRIKRFIPLTILDSDRTKKRHIPPFFEKPQEKTQNKRLMCENCVIISEK